MLTGAVRPRRVDEERPGHRDVELEPRPLLPRLVGRDHRARQVRVPAPRHDLARVPPRDRLRLRRVLTRVRPVRRDRRHRERLPRGHHPRCARLQVPPARIAPRRRQPRIRVLRPVDAVVDAVRVRRRISRDALTRRLPCRQHHRTRRRRRRRPGRRTSNAQCQRQHHDETPHRGQHPAAHAGRPVIHRSILPTSPDLSRLVRTRPGLRTHATRRASHERPTGLAPRPAEPASVRIAIVLVHPSLLMIDMIRALDGTPSPRSCPTRGAAALPSRSASWRE